VAPRKVDESDQLVDDLLLADRIKSGRLPVRSEKSTS